MVRRPGVRIVEGGLEVGHGQKPPKERLIMRMFAVSACMLAWLAGAARADAATTEQLAYERTKRLVAQAPPSESIEGELARRNMVSRASRFAVMSLASAPERDDAEIAALNSEIEQNDAADSDFVRGIVAMGDGWLRGQFNRRSVYNIWLIVQHSSDVNLQERVLQQIRPFVEAGMIDSQDYALLFDRVAVRHGRAQLYGTQLACSGGRYVLSPIEHESDVEVRRKAMGFELSLEAYLATFSEMTC